MRTLLAALVLLGGPTNPPPKCVTACGMTGDFDADECEALNVVEARAVKAYQDLVPEFRPGYAACMALSGFRVEVRQRQHWDKRFCDEGWLLTYGTESECVVGRTRFEEKLVEVTDKSFAFNALAHELGHVLEHAFDYRGAGHCDWEKRGLKAAILRVTGEKDDSAEECPADAGR